MGRSADNGELFGAAKEPPGRRTPTQNRPQRVPAKPLPVLTFARLCDQKGVPRPEKEWNFHPSRNWRMDLAWPKEKVALEVHGAVFQNGRHNRGDGFLKDREKMNEAQLMGWIVLEVARSEGSEESWCCYDVVSLVKRAIQRQKIRTEHPPVNV